MIKTSCEASYIIDCLLKCSEFKCVCCKTLLEGVWWDLGEIYQAYKAELVTFSLGATKVYLVTLIFTSIDVWIVSKVYLAYSDPCAHKRYNYPILICLLSIIIIRIMDELAFFFPLTLDLCRFSARPLWDGFFIETNIKCI